MRSMPTFGGFWGVLGVFGVLFCGVLSVLLGEFGVLTGVSCVFCVVLCIFCVLLIVSCFFLSVFFFKCDFSGVNFTARLLPTFPRKNGH